MLKKAEDAANEALRQRLLEDAAAHLALAATQRATKKQTRAGRNDGSSLGLVSPLFCSIVALYLVNEKYY
jgi:hypothetical protein